MKRSLPALLALALAASACGGGEEAAPATTVAATEASTTEAPTTTAAPTTEAPTTLVEAQDLDESDVAELSGVGTAYCDASLEAEELNEAWDPTDPASTELTLTRTSELLASVDPHPAIADEFYFFRDGYGQLVDAAAAADYNMLAIPDDLPILNDSAMDDAADALEDFDSYYCGEADGENSAEIVEEAAGEEFDDILDGADNDAVIELLQTEIGRQAFIDEMIADGTVDISEAQATCMVDNLDGDLLGVLLAAAEGGEPSTEDTLAFLEVLDSCDIPLSAFG